MVMVGVEGKSVAPFNLLDVVTSCGILSFVSGKIELSQNKRCKECCYVARKSCWLQEGCVGRVGCKEGWVGCKEGCVSYVSYVGYVGYVARKVVCGV